MRTRNFIRRIRGFVLCGAAASLLIGAAMPASADPSNSNTDSLSALKAKIAQTQQTLTAQNTAAEKASEAYNGAVLQLQFAQQVLADAQDKLTQAEQDLGAAKREALSFAISDFTGTTPNPLAAVFGAGGPNELAGQLGTVEILANTRSTAINQYATAEKGLATARSTAAKAVDRNRKTVTALDTKRKSLLADAGKSDALLGDLQAQQTDLEAAAAKEAAEAKARSDAAAAARAQAEADAAAQARAATADQRQLSAQATSAITANPVTAAVPAVTRRAATPPASRSATPRPPAASARPAAPSSNGGSGQQRGGAASSPPPAPAAPSAAPTSAPVPPETTAAAPVTPSPTPTKPQSDTSTGARAVQIAYKYLGTPYVFGAAGPNGFDCSGLTMYVYAQLGIYLDHWTVSQVNQGTRVSRGNLMPGDLVFFGSDYHHVGIYVGGGQMIDAPHTGAVVRVEAMWSDYSAAVRPY